jgi:predicted pore-forming effector associated with SMODS systems
MIEPKHFKILAAIGVALWAATLYSQGTPLHLALLKPFSIVVTAMAVSWSAFDRWVWRWQPLSGWFVSRPDLQGTWKGKLASNWEDSNTGERTQQIQVYVVVRQTYSKVAIRLFTAESSSQSSSAQVNYDEERVYTVAATYTNTPRILNRNRSPMHRGAVVFQVVGGPPVALTGEYWTDRETKGEITLGARCDTLADSFDQASLFQYAEPREHAATAGE